MTDAEALRLRGQRVKARARGWQKRNYSKQDYDGNQEVDDGREI